MRENKLVDPIVLLNARQKSIHKSKGVLRGKVASPKKQKLLKEETEEFYRFCVRLFALEGILFYAISLWFILLGKVSSHIACNIFAISCFLAATISFYSYKKNEGRYG